MKTEMKKLVLIDYVLIVVGVLNWVLCFYSTDLIVKIVPATTGIACFLSVLRSRIPHTVYLVISICVAIVALANLLYLIFNK
jgi:hypothetical protein